MGTEKSSSLFINEPEGPASAAASGFFQLAQNLTNYVPFPLTWHLLSSPLFQLTPTPSIQLCNSELEDSLGPFFPSLTIPC